MKKLFFITIILLLQSFPSYGSSPNGKGIICNFSFVVGSETFFIDEKRTIPSEVGFVFSNNSVTMNIFSYNDVSKTVSLIPFPPKEFSTTKTDIFWSYKWGSFQLGRKELILILDKNGVVSSYECKVYSHIDYSYEIDKLRNKHNKFFNEKIDTSDNKI